MTRRHAVLGPVAAVLGIVLTVATLLTIVVGTRGDSGPATIDTDQVPFGLLRDPETATSSTTTTPSQPSFTLFFVTKEHLVAVQRSRGNPPSPHDVLQALIAGPTKTERDRGLTSLLSPTASLRRVSIDGYRAVIDLAAPFENTPTTNSSLSVAQVVYTATALPGVTEVRFLLKGKTVEVPTGNSALTRRPVARSDYPIPVS